jgi:hypothetical protein
MRWQKLFDVATLRPLALDNLAEHATAALLGSGNILAQKAFAADSHPDLYFLCSVLDTYSVDVPEDVARLIGAVSRW